MRLRTHHVSHVLSSCAGFLPPLSSGVVGAVDGVVGGAGWFGIVGVEVGGGAPPVGGSLGVVVGGGESEGGGGGSLGSRSPGGIAPAGFLNRMHASAPSIGSSSGAASRAGNSQERTRMKSSFGRTVRSAGLQSPQQISYLRLERRTTAFSAAVTAILTGSRAIRAQPPGDAALLGAHAGGPGSVHIPRRMQTAESNGPRGSPPARGRGVGALG